MHPVDERLQALIDGELDSAESSRTLAHLETCDACRTRREALELALKETAVLLGTLDQEGPEISVEQVIRMAERRDIGRSGGGGRRMLRAASLAGLLVAGAVAAAVVPGSPVREVVERIVRGPAAEQRSPAAVPDPWRQEAGVALVADHGLEVTFEAGQAEGSIELVEAGGDTARVEVRSDSVGFVVGDGSVLVQNRGSRASYRIAVPSDLPNVRILVGPRAVYEVKGGEVLQDEFQGPGSGRRLPLSETR